MLAGGQGDEIFGFCSRRFHGAIAVFDNIGED